MTGPLDRSDDQTPPGAKVGQGRDWFNDCAELAALTGPNGTTCKAGRNDFPVISASADSDEIARALKQGVHEFNVSSLMQGDQRVVFFGERHDDPTHKDEIIKNLKTLKEKNGLTHVAMEMLNTSDMPNVSDYFAGTGSRKAVLDRLKDRWSQYPGAPEKYMEMIDAVKSAGLIPLALDENSTGRDDNRGTLFQDRNQHWAEVINGALTANSKAKVLVYSGRDHVGYSSKHDRANEILKSTFGQSSAVVMFTSKVDTTQTLSGKVSHEAAKAHLSSKQFALTLDPSGVNRPADVVLHEPG
jgi:hypothetical protein